MTYQTILFASRHKKVLLGDGTPVADFRKSQLVNNFRNCGASCGIQSVDIHPQTDKTTNMAKGEAMRRRAKNFMEAKVGAFGNCSMAREQQRCHKH